MAKLSIGQAWDDSKAVLARDGGLIFTVALALIVVPGTVSDLFQPQVPEGEMAEPGWWTLLSLAAILIGLIGQLAIARIALGQGQSVGEAIAHGARRLPALLGAMLLWLLPIALLFVPFALQVQANPQDPPPAAAAVVLLIAVLLVVIGVRLILTTPVASAEAAGPITILKRSWTLTRGNWWRLFGFLLLFFIAAFIGIMAVTAVVGIAVGLADGAPEPLSVGALLMALTSQLLAAALTLLLVTMLTRIYLQLSGTTADPASVPHAP